MYDYVTRDYRNFSVVERVVLAGWHHLGGEPG